MDLHPLIIVLISFSCELIDSSLGMGYGTMLTPILLLLGFEPLDVIPAIIFSEFISGTFASIFHHLFKNVDFKYNSHDIKIAIILSLFGLIGTFFSVKITLALPTNILKILIAIIVISMSVVIIRSNKIRTKVNWIKLMFFGAFAAFNKGVSGGAYGPVVMGGQLLSGIAAKKAIAIASFSEAFTCLSATLLYLNSGQTINWNFCFLLTIGAFVSTPIAALFVKSFHNRKLSILAAIIIFILGTTLLIKEL